MLSELASHGALSYFIRKFPYQSEKNYQEIQLLDSKYKHWKVAYVFIALGLFFTLPFLYAYILHPITVFFHNQFLGEGDRFYPPSVSTVGVVTFFWSFATLIFVSQAVMRLLLGYNADEFFDYYNHSQKYDNRKAGIWFGKIFFIISLPLYPFFLTAKIVTSEKTFTIKTVVDFNERIYRYNELKAIHYYQSYEDRDGIIHPKKIAVFYFTDGDTFKPGFYFDDIKKSMQFAEYLSAKSDIKIDTVAVQYFKNR